MPAFVTAIGLIFAVLTERVSWSVAFKTVVFLPMAISAFATGVTWRIMYVQDPNLGAVNALGRVGRHDAFKPARLALDALPSTPALTGSAQTGMVLKTPLHPGGVALLGTDRRSRPRTCRRRAKQAVAPAAEAGPHRRASSGATSSRAAASRARSRQGELGLPGVTVQLREQRGQGR